MSQSVPNQSQESQYANEVSANGTPNSSIQPAIQQQQPQTTPITAQPKQPIAIIQKAPSTQPTPSSSMSNFPIQQSAFPKSSFNGSGEVRLPELQFPDMNSQDFDFQTEACKLMQANTVLTELVKEHILDKYRIGERIIKVTELIKKMENRGNPSTK